MKHPSGEEKIQVQRHAITIKNNKITNDKMSADACIQYSTTFINIDLN